MASARDAAEHLTKFTRYEWEENDAGISIRMDSYPYSDGALDGMIEWLKTEYPFLKKDLGVTTLTDAKKLISSTAYRHDMAGVKVELLWGQPKPVRVTISHEIVKKITEALCLQKKVAVHLTNLTGTEWKIKGGGVYLSSSWQHDLSEFEEAVNIIKEHYPGHFTEVTDKWDRSVYIPNNGVEAIAKLNAYTDF